MSKDDLWEIEQNHSLTKKIYTHTKKKYLGIIFGNLIILPLLFINIAQEPFYSTFLLILQIYTPLTISLGPIFYRYILKRSHLILDLEKSRGFLIDVFDIDKENPAEYLDEEPEAKYLRINLMNIEKKWQKIAV